MHVLSSNVLLLLVCASFISGGLGIVFLDRCLILYINMCFPLNEGAWLRWGVDWYVDG